MAHSPLDEPREAAADLPTQDAVSQAATDAGSALGPSDTPSSKRARRSVPNGAPQLEALPQGPRWSRDTLRLPAGCPCDLDVGFGRGGSLRHWVEQRAETGDRALLAVEIKHGCAAAVHAWAAARQATHVSVFQGDVLTLLRHRADDLRFERIFVHFPDPWWKARHAKRQVLRDATLPSFWAALQPGGHLYLQTDVEDRARTFIALAGALPGASVSQPEHNPYPSVSNREVRATQDGLPIYRVDVAKSAA